ncbi:flagellar hook-associated protein FlgK [Shimia sp.]|uniref:flagellar hook-associated protein FlgK n=1 Tax=Shimia sp. TaxID=1954381 RepID=UPI003297F6B7
MSISGALSNALTGLTATARAAEVVSSNLSNIMTDGYGRREVSLSSQNYRSSGGVMVNAIKRYSNPVILAERRMADSAFGQLSSLNSAYQQIEKLMGTPDQANSLSGMVVSLESSLITASGSPGNTTRLKNVAVDAEALAQTFNNASQGVQDLREQADRSIEDMVGRLNTLLTRTQEMNRDISTAINKGFGTASLEDDRQRILDEISELVPVRQIARDRGAIALYTTNGAVLLDGSAVEIEFTPTPTIQPHMTVDNGLLDGLCINGIEIRIESDTGALSGGALGAQFEIRDELALQTQADLDAGARSLIERFQSTTTDPTLSAGEAGLFTDSGAAFDASDETGLAGRLRLNTLVAPDGAGEFWRLRDGLGATAPGDVGDASILTGLGTALSGDVQPSSGSFASDVLSMAGLADRILSAQSSNRVISDEDLSFAATKLSGLEAMELAEGVDSDHEIQQLMLIEQAYAANARVVEAIDEMMNQLLRL